MNLTLRIWFPSTRSFLQAWFRNKAIVESFVQEKMFYESELQKWGVGLLDSFSAELFPERYRQRQRSQETEQEGNYT